MMDEMELTAEIGGNYLLYLFLILFGDLTLPARFPFDFVEDWEIMATEELMVEGEEGV